MTTIDRLTSRLSRRLAVRGAGAAGLGTVLGWRAGAVAAQDATPASDGTCTGDPSVGSTTSVVGPEGAEIARITVDDLVDPFQDYNPNSPPQAGQRFVVAHVTVEVTGPRALRVDPYHLLMQDAEGFVYQPASLSLPDTTTETLFEGADVESGSSAEGLLAYSVIRGAQVTRLFYQPQSDRLLLVADLRG